MLVFLSITAFELSSFTSITRITRVHRQLYMYVNCLPYYTLSAVKTRNFRVNLCCSFSKSWWSIQTGVLLRMSSIEISACDDYACNYCCCLSSLFVFVISNWLAARYDSKALCVPVITPYLWDSLLPAVSAWLSQCLPYFWSMVTVGFDKREPSAPEDSLAKCGIGMPFIHFLWFTRRSLKFSDLVLLGTSHFLSPSLPF